MNSTGCKRTKRTTCARQYSRRGQTRGKIYRQTRGVYIYCRRKAVITVTNERFVALGSPTLDFNRSCRDISRGHWLIMPSNFRLDHQAGRHVRVFEWCTQLACTTFERSKLFPLSYRFIQLILVLIIS